MKEYERFIYMKKLHETDLEGQHKLNPIAHHQHRNL